MPRTIKMKPLSVIQDNYEASGPKASANYEAGVKANTTQHERAFSDASEKKYGLAVNEAARKKTRQTEGNKKSSQTIWRNRAVEKGVPAIGAAIPLSGGKMIKGYTPIHQALEGMEIPDKGLDPYTNIDNILKPVVKRMREAAGKE